MQLRSIVAAGAVAGALVAGGCTRNTPRPRLGYAAPDALAPARFVAPAAFVAPDWRQIATPFDRDRIRDWRTAWVDALTRARGGGHGPAIAREGALLDPDAAIPNPALPDGTYSCRVLKVGGQGEGVLDYVAYPAFACSIDRERGLQHFAKLTGSQRPVGHLYPDTDSRQVFLGTLMLGDERMAMRYGMDRDRDLAGIVQRIGPRRWRLVLPRPRFESITDVIELIPR